MHDLTRRQPHPNPVQKVQPANGAVTNLLAEVPLEAGPTLTKLGRQDGRDGLDPGRPPASHERLRFVELDLLDLGIGRLKHPHDPPADRARKRPQNIRLAEPRWQPVETLHQRQPLAEGGVERGQQRQKGVAGRQGRHWATAGDAGGDSG